MTKPDPQLLELQAKGSDSQFLEFIRSQPSCISGQWSEWNNQRGEGRCEACHYRTANNSGVSQKPPYSAIPMTRSEHREQHRIGQFNFRRREWWESKVQHYRDLWLNSQG